MPDSSRNPRVLLWLLCACILFAAPVTGAGAAPSARRAARLLQRAGVSGGVISHVGCGEGGLTDALRRGGSFIVHGLDRDAADVRAAREYLRDRGATGKVSVMRLRGDRLPYADGLLNLLIVEEPDGLPREEMMRVLAPGGVLLQKTADGWRKDTKQRPDEMDSWTHYLHGPDNNAVSKDRRVGPPTSIRWVGGPGLLRHHGHLASVSTMVSADGRLYIVEDRGPRLSMDLPSRWRLVARDAHNGVILWKRSISRWADRHHRFRNGPLDLSRRLVADDGRVFVTLERGGPVKALDGATGETLQTYEHTEGTEEILFDSGTLYLTVTAGSEGNRRVMAVDADGGDIRWGTDGDAVQNTLLQTLTVGASRLFLHNGGGIVGLDRGTGEVLWRKELSTVSKRPPWSAPTVVYHDGVVLCVDRATSYPREWQNRGKFNSMLRKRGGPARVRALSARDGRVLWTEMAAENFHSPANLFVADDLVWFGQSPNWYAFEAMRPALRQQSEEWWTDAVLQGRDPRTGEVERKVDPAEAFTRSHHHRCYRGKATERYILMGRTGVEFVDLEQGEHRRHNWIRGTCQYGIMPANGLLYVPPHPCACYMESKLNGFLALSSEKPKDEPSDVARLQKGDAAGQKPASGADTGDWPTYRADNARSAFARTDVPAEPEKKWTTEVGGDISAPVAADGKVFVAATDRHSVHALSMSDGAHAWRFTAGGRVDSPPTFWRGRVIFGCADGNVYCLDADDGGLVWRFRAAPRRKLISAEGQLESAWPVPGSVLVKDGSVYCLAGRSSYVDGGMYFVKLDAETGEPLMVKQKYSRDPETGRQPPERGWDYGSNALELPGLLPDVPSARGDTIFVRQVPLTEDGERKPDYERHLFNPLGFLSDSWWHRAYTVYGKRYYSGPFVLGKAAQKWPSGRMLTLDDRFIYGFGRKSVRGRGSRSYRLFGTRKSAGKKKLWTTKLPVLAYALVLANPEHATGQSVGRRLLAAGPPGSATKSYGAYRGEEGGSLLTIDPDDGSIVSRTPLQSPPVHDGMCAADGNVVLTTRDGSVAFFGRGQ